MTQRLSPLLSIALFLHSGPIFFFFEVTAVVEDVDYLFGTEQSGPAVIRWSALI